MGLICALLNLYLLVLLVRAVLSWFPTSPDSGLWPVHRALWSLTEPVLAPLRRVIPPLGMFDLSLLAVFFLIQFLLKPALGCSAGGL